MSEHSPGDTQIINREISIPGPEPVDGPEARQPHSMTEPYSVDTPTAQYDRVLPGPEPIRVLPSIEQVHDIKVRQLFGRKINSAHYEGWMPDTAISHMGRLISTNVYTHDRITADEDYSLEETYVYDEQDDESIPTFDVFVNPDHAKDPKVLTRAFLEIIAGEKHTGTDGDPYGGPVASRGLEQVVGYTPGGIALNKAVTEHLADSLLYGDVDATDPDSPARKGARHADERSLLHVLAGSGDQPVDIRLFSAALFEDNATADRLGDASAQSQFRVAVAKAFPFTDVIKEISELEPTDGQSPQQLVAEYASQLAERAERHRRVTAKAASLVARRIFFRKAA